MTNAVTQAEFAALMNVSKKTVTVWKQDGRLVMSGSKVDVEASRRRIEQTGGTRPDVAARHAEERAKKASGHVDENKSKTDAGMRLQDSRAVKEQYAALKAKAEYETLIGDLIPREDVDAALRFIGATVRAALDVLPDQTAPLVAPITSLAECHEAIADACRDALHSIGAAVDQQKSEIFKADQ